MLGPLTDKVKNAIMSDHTALTTKLIANPMGAVQSVIKSFTGP